MDMLVSDIRLERHHSGLGLGTSVPRIFWHCCATEDTSPSQWYQSACDIQIARGDRDSVQTYHLETTQSHLLPWPSEPLRSREEAHLRVRVYGFESDDPSPWSIWTSVECALLAASDGSAKFIRPKTIAIAHDRAEPPNSSTRLSGSTMI